LTNPRKKDETYQPKTLIWRQANYDDHLAQVLGVLDYDNNFDNTFQKWKLIRRFISDVMENIKQGTIPLVEKQRLDLVPDKSAINKMIKIWNGQTYLGLILSHDKTKVLAKQLFFEEPEPIYKHRGSDGKIIDTYEREIIQMPKLKNMVPVGEISAETWGIQIRESLPLKYAWAETNYATLINDGKFFHHLADGSIPKIKPEEMQSLVKRTYILSRPVYNMIMDILGEAFEDQYSIFTANVQKIMKWMKEEGKKWIHAHDIESDLTPRNDLSGY